MMAACREGASTIGNGPWPPCLQGQQASSITYRTKQEQEKPHRASRPRRASRPSRTDKMRFVCKSSRWMSSDNKKVHLSSYFRVTLSFRFLSCWLCTRRDPFIALLQINILPSFFAPEDTWYHGSMDCNCSPLEVPLLLSYLQYASLLHLGAQGATPAAASALASPRCIMPSTKDGYGLHQTSLAPAS
jgi:hypothetical protein